MSRLREIIDIVNATEENAFDDLAEMLKPEDFDRYSAGEAYESCLGYDPVSYFDKKEIDDKVKALDTECMPEGVASIVVDESERIANFAYEIFDERRSDFMDEAINQAISDVTGWDWDCSTYNEEDIDDDVFDEDE